MKDAELKFARNTEAIRARQEVRYGDVFLWKPAQPAETLEFQLAPLIIQPADALNKGSFAAASAAQTNVVLSGADTILIGGKPYARVFYLWEHAVSQPGAEANSGMQGIRMTLGASGRPLIWESLSDSTGAQIVFIAEALEEAAKKQFGPPAKGMLSSLEPDETTNSPSKPIIARALQDGPVPMGPVLYLDDGSSTDIVTVICRCMPSQATNVVGTREYILRPARNPWPAPGSEPLHHLRLPALEGL